MKPSAWLDQNRAVDQLTWLPGATEIVENRVIDQGGVIDREGIRLYNLYRAPGVIPGASRAAERWRDTYARSIPTKPTTLSGGLRNGSRARARRSIMGSSSQAIRASVKTRSLSQ
jgi:hypothetical protein